jgi:hypothetical protein
MGECQEAMGRRHRDGYVWAWDTEQKREMLAHRLAWQQRFGEIPAGLMVMHACDNPACINIDHLLLGSHTDNMRDMWSKDRAGGAPIQRRNQTHCLHGHEFNDGNTYVRPNGTRCCRTCRAERRRVRV